KKVWLRGLPDNAVAYDAVTGKPSIDPAWVTLFETYTTYLTTNNYQIKFLSPNANAGEVQPIQRVAFSTEGALVLKFAGAPAAVFQPGVRVIVRKYRGALGVKVNGPTKVIERAADGTLTLNKWAVHCTDQETAGGAAELVREIYSFVSIFDSHVLAPSSHKVG